MMLSFALHFLLSGLLIWGSMSNPKESRQGGNGDYIDAVIVDTNAVMQHYNRQEQPSLSVCEKQPFSAKSGAETQQQDFTRTTARQVKFKKRQDKTVRTQPKTKTQAEEEVKNNITSIEKYTTVQTATWPKDIDALLNALTDIKNAPNDSIFEEGRAEEGRQHRRDKQAMIDSYAAEIRQAIQKKFYDYRAYRGKTCDIRFKLASDGLLISVNAIGGDPELCQASLSAAKLANIPPPPNQAIYKAAKEGRIIFRPE